MDFDEIVLEGSILKRKIRIDLGLWNNIFGGVFLHQKFTIFTLIITHLVYIDATNTDLQEMHTK